MKNVRVIIPVVVVLAVALGVVMLLWSRHQPVTSAGGGKPPEAVKPSPVGPSAYLINEKDPPTQADPELTRKLIATQKAENVSEVAALLFDVKKDATTRNETANLLRRSGYIRLSDDLIKSLGSAEEGPLWRSYCIQHLWMNVKDSMPDEKAKIVGVLRSSITDRHTRVRREALLALARLNDPLGKETAVKWLSAKEGEGARDVAIRCAEDLKLRDQAPAIRKLAADPDESTAIQAIGILGRWGDEASRPVFEEAAKAKSQRLQNAAKSALKRLDSAKGVQPPIPQDSRP